METNFPHEGKSKHEIIEEYYYLVILCAQKHKNQGIAYTDLINAGNTGLGKAIDTFWKTKQDFSKHAYACIDRQMRLNVEHNKQSSDLSNSYDDLSKLSVILRDFVDKNSTPEERSKRFKDSCEGRKAVLVVDYVNRKITTSSEFNKTHENVRFLPKTNRISRGKERTNNVIKLRKTTDEV